MILGVVGLLFFGYIFVLGIRAFFKRTAPPLRAVRHGTSAQGVVTGVTTQVVGQGGATRRLERPIVTFVDAKGLKVKYTEKMTRPGSGTAGEHVTVHYNPADPEHTATIATVADIRRQLTVAGLFFLALLAMCATSVLLIAGVWKA
jgi:Protein of unknown function (DUF3592)